MHRVLISPRAIQGGRIRVHDPGQLHHLLHVLRVNTGDALECFDGEGRRYAGRVIKRSPQELIVQLGAASAEPFPAVQVTLAVSLIKFDRFEWMVQKATELGADRLIPLVTARTVIRPSSAQAAGRLQRWRRIIQEAGRQCDRQRLPEIELPQTVERVVAECGPEICLLVPTLAGQTVPLRDALAGLNTCRSAMVLIGPEGDFTPEEAQAAARHGARLVSLGAMTLRSETAALATLAVVRYAAGMFG